MVNEDRLNRGASTEPVKQKPKGLTWWRAFKLCLLAVFVYFLISVFTANFHRGGEGDRTKAMAHLKKVWIGVLTFENDNGMRPGQAVVKKGEVPGAKAASANDVFRQLLQGGVLNTEAFFYAKSAISRKPDNKIGSPQNNFAQSLEKGECAFLYVDNPEAKIGAPLCAAPLKSDHNFDAGAYNGKAVVLMNNGSVEVIKIDPETGKLMVTRDGKTFDLFSADNPDFNGKKPRILYPEH